MRQYDTRLEKLEKSLTAGSANMAVIFEEVDGNDRLTAYAEGFRSCDRRLARLDDEPLDAFEERVSTTFGADSIRVSFVPAKDGKPAWRNGVGPT